MPELDEDEFFADEYSHYTDQELAETPAQRRARLQVEKMAKTTPKGTCPKCGTHIGRGIAFHIKACGV